MSDFPSLTYVVQLHSRLDQWGGPEWDCGADSCSASGTGNRDYAEHIAEVWSERSTIRTAGQLDALPDGAVVRVRAGLLYASAEKSDGHWWAPGLERPVNPRALLHARLLELPTERGQW